MSGEAGAFILNKEKFIMKSKTFVGFVCGLCLIGTSQLVQAASIHPLTSQEQAKVGATHLVIVTYADFAASTSTNTAKSFTNFTAAAGSEVELVEMKLETPFDTGNTNYTGAVALTVGDSSDADLFLTSTELASDGSEVFIKAGRTDVPGVTVASNFVATVTAGVRGKKVYTTATPVITTFTPNAEEALSANTAGEVRLYFKVFSR